MSDDEAFAEAFRLKAQQLREQLSTRPLAPEALAEVRPLLEQAKAAFQGGRMEDAAVLAAQALQRARQG